MTSFSEKLLISNRCISSLMSNLIKKSWTDSIEVVVLISPVVVVGAVVVVGSSFVAVEPV